MSLSLFLNSFRGFPIKEIAYYFDDKGHKEGYHETVCGGDRKEGTVTGIVAKKNGKNWIKPLKVKYAEK